MAYDIGAKIGIDGEAEFRRQLREINTGLKTLGSEMTVVTSSFLGQEKSVQSLSAQNDVLNRTLYTLNDRLELQKKMLAESAKAYGENDERTQKWQQELNKTQTAINKTNAQVAKNNTLMEELGETTEETAEIEEKAAERSVAASEKRSKALKALSKVAVAAVAAAATAVGGLVKNSLDGYAEFEQLVGGVDTLFGWDSKIVKANAEQAYKTSGLSANKYMETVTSFSASLIDSLYGNTTKAATLADQAIIDMADNANKMGTDISMIQNAYQGFAKQNYTMLDNLKLGYGGTKEEMERLLKTASEISGVTYNISSFADIVDAIHVVQTKMGITGTTAKEAAETIQGSTAAMEAAWKNLVVGIAQDSTDLDNLIGNFVDSVRTVADNVIPRVGQILDGVSHAVERLAPVLSDELPALLVGVLPTLVASGAKIIGALVSGIISALPGLIPAALEMVTTLADQLLSATPEIIKTGAEILTVLVQGLATALPELAGKGVEIISTLATSLQEALPQLVAVAAATLVTLATALTQPEMLTTLLDAAVTIIQALADGLIEVLPTLLAAVPEILKNLVAAIVEAAPQLLVAGAELLMTLGMGLVAAIPELLSYVIQVPAAIIGGIKEGLDEVKNIGPDIIRGLWEGLESMYAWLDQKITGFFEGIVDGIKGLLGIHSPSTVFSGVGHNMAAGIGKGWENTFPAIRRDIEKSMTFSMGGGNWTDQVQRNLAMDLTGPAYAGRTAETASRAAAAATGAAQSGDIVINVTETIDGAVLARNQYRYNRAEQQRQGPELVKGG